MLDQSTQYQVLRYLGWPVRTIDPTSLSYSNIITERLQGFPDDADTILTGLLTRISNIDTQLDAQIMRANVQQVDDIIFFQDGTFELRRERSKLVREIASLMDMPIGPGAKGGSMGGVCV